MENTKNPLLDVPKVDSALWVAKVGGRIHFRDDGGYQTRHTSTERIVRLMDARYPDLPSFGPTYIHTNDTPPANPVVAVSLAYSMNKEAPVGPRGQQVLAVPDYVFDHWEQVGIHDYDEICAQITRAGSAPAAKKLAGWIGSKHCHASRETLMQISEKHPTMIEAINTGHWQSADPNSKRMNVGEGRFMTLAEQAAAWAYLLDVEGNGWSGRLKLLFHAGRPVLLQDRPWQEFYFPWIKPFEHYVPVARDLSDLTERVAWLGSHPEEAQRIGQNGLNFARKHLTRTGAVDYWAHIVRTVAPLSPLK